MGGWVEKGRKGSERTNESVNQHCKRASESNRGGRRFRGCRNLRGLPVVVVEVVGTRASHEREVRSEGDDARSVPGEGRGESRSSDESVREPGDSSRDGGGLRTSAGGEGDGAGGGGEDEGVELVVGLRRREEREEGREEKRRSQRRRLERERIPRARKEKKGGGI